MISYQAGIQLDDILRTMKIIDRSPPAGNQPADAPRSHFVLPLSILFEVVPADLALGLDDNLKAAVLVASQVVAALAQIIIRTDVADKALADDGLLLTAITLEAVVVG